MTSFAFNQLLSPPLAKKIVVAPIKTIEGGVKENLIFLWLVQILEDRNKLQKFQFRFIGSEFWWQKYTQYVYVKCTIRK